MRDESHQQFILIDHSIRSLGGHYYEYATHVLEAAAELGYRPVLATNREFDVPSSPARWQVAPVYRYDVWGISGGLRRARGRGRRLVKRFRRAAVLSRVKFKYSVLGLSWSLARHPGELLAIDSRRARRAVWRFPLAFFFLQALRTAVWLRRHARSLLRPVLRGWFRRMLGMVRRGAGRTRALLAASAHRFAGRTRWAILGHLERRRRRAFAADTARLFAQVDLARGDVVFIPTLSTVDLEGLGDYLKAHPASSAASWHLLFRRNIYTGREGPEWAAQDAAQGPVRDAFAAFRRSTPGHRVRFYTDTDPLTAQYNRLGLVRFETLPIPVNPAFRKERPGPAREPLRITYAGDARREKGYHLLPDILSDLSRDLLPKGRVKFVLQSNFAFPNPEKEAAVVAARQRLKQFPSREVEIILQPLTTVEYCDLILSGDLSLLLYNPESYAARSSGVFVESLCAGIPVIVPEGSWMAAQIRNPSYRHSAALLRSGRVLAARRGGELVWTDGHRKEPVFAGGALRVGGGPSPSATVLEVPPGASHLVLSFRFSEDTLRSTPGARVLFSAGAEGRKRAPRSVLLEAGSGDARPSTVLPLRGAAERLSLRFSGGLSGGKKGESLRIQDLEVAFLEAGAGGAVPLGAVGLIYQDPAEVPDLVRDLVEHYPHYRETARSFAREYAQFHSPERLVEEIRQRALEGQAARGVAVA